MRLSNEYLDIIDKVERLRTTHPAEPLAKAGPYVFAPSDAVRLAGSLPPMFVVRRLFECLGLDEYAPFRWDLDHKLVQAILLHTFAPNAGLLSYGLRALATGVSPEEARMILSSTFPRGYVVKPVRGYGSKRLDVLHSSSRLDEYLVAACSAKSQYARDEKYYVQECVDAVRECRVHVLDGEVIPSLTIKQFGSYSHLGGMERYNVNAFVADVIRQLPSSMTRGIMSAWDVGQLRNGQYCVFEINYAGFHPVYEAGFQCSGYFLKPECAYLNLARLLRHASEMRSVECRFDLGKGHGDLEYEAVDILYRVDRWLQLLQLRERIGWLWKDIQRSQLARGEQDSVALHTVMQQNRETPNDLDYCGVLQSLERLTCDLDGWTDVI